MSAPGRGNRGSRFWGPGEGAWLWVIGVAAFLLSLTAIRDPDLGFHLANARDFLAGLGWSAPDRYTFTQAGRDPLAHSTLANLAFFAAFSLGGAAGLVLLKAGLVTAVVMVWAVGAIRFGAPRAITALLFLVAGIFARERFLERPLLFTEVLAALYFFRLFGLRGRTPDKRNLIWIASLVFFSALFHAGVVYLGIFFLAFSLGEFFEHRKHLWSRIVPLAGASMAGFLLAFLFVPSVRNILPHLWFVVRDVKTSYVAEYASGWVSSPLHLLIMGALAVLIWRRCVRSGASLPKHGWFPWITFGLLFFQTSRYGREVFRLSFVWAFLISTHWPFGSDRAATKQERRTLLRREAVVLVLFTVLLSSELRNPRYPLGFGFSSRVIPLEGMAAVAGHLDSPKRLYNSMAYGGWWSFLLPTKGSIYQDGRSPLYGAEFFSKSVRPLLSGDLSATKRIFEEYRVEGAMIDRDDPLCSVLSNDPSWGLQVAEEDLVFFERDTSGYLTVDPCGGDDSRLWLSAWLGTSAGEAEIDDMVDKSPGNSWASFAQGVARARRGDVKAAWESFHRSALGSDAPALAPLHAAQMVCDLGDLATAKEEFARAETALLDLPDFWKIQSDCLKPVQSLPLRAWNSVRAQWYPFYYQVSAGTLPF